MSVLSSQSKELREKADMLDGLEGMDNLVPMLREAADTIESLWDKLQLVPAELDYIEDKSRWAELFGTPERAARTYLDYFLNGCDGSTCADGCPFFDTSMYMNCALGTDDYDALLEWLRGDAE